jgi:hypothetical protein
MYADMLLASDIAGNQSEHENEFGRNRVLETETEWMIIDDRSSAVWWLRDVKGLAQPKAGRSEAEPGAAR